MASAKNELFSEEHIQQANFFKALAHPARVQILKYLASQDNCITGDISDHLPLSRTTVNQHIKELKNVGLIKGEICGVRTKYCLNKENISLLEQNMMAFINDLNTTNCKC